MNNKKNPMHQPYEIVETEETITRYFNPYSKKSPSCNNNQKVPQVNLTHKERQLI